jgi:drug/metabolite transporter (DMT)-like permease
VIRQGRNAITLGAGLVVIYTALISSADAITKFIAGGYAAPQLFCLSGLIVMGLCIVTDRLPSQRRGFRTQCPKALSLRCIAAVLASAGFFYAFKYLPFAEVFLFVGLIPLLAGLMSGLVLGEHVRPTAWVALAAGFVGVLCLFPNGIGGITLGHVVAFVAIIIGTFSMVLARYIGRYESNALAQVFYTNAAIFVAMAVVLPFVWKPMPLTDVGWVGAYAVLLFGARWLLVVALRLLAAYAVTPLMNLQFVWMVILGAVFFNEYPAPGTYLGVGIVISSGMFLVWDQFTPADQRKPIFGSLNLRSTFKTDP